jgi:hypothetical protein
VGIDKLFQKLELVAFDSDKKIRIYRFLQTFAHGSPIDEPQHDPNLLGEAPKVMTELLELVAAVDRPHFEELLRTLTDPP